MPAALSQMLNVLALYAISSLLIVAFSMQLALNELPCPLCMMQRALFCAMGAGYENIDVAYAKAHGIAVGNGVLHAHRLVELRPQLIEINDFEPGPLLHLAFDRRELSQEQPQERRLA